MDRDTVVNHFYGLLANLERHLGGKRSLATCHGRMPWPQRGMYFFFEHGEPRAGGNDLRVVRVGTHAVSQGSRTKLWTRLRTHRGRLSGARAGGGNHRGSIFRLHVGTAILQQNRLREQYPTWSQGSSAPRSVRDHEHPIEQLVSRHIRAMPFLWLAIDDAPNKKSMRAYLERNIIALLSNYQQLGTSSAIDPPSPTWLGQFCEHPSVRLSGLWNVEHTQVRSWELDFLDKLESYIEKM